MAKRVCVIEGDDAAPEVVRPTVQLLEGMELDLELLRPLTGEAAIQRYGSGFPPEAREAIDRSDATLFGATSGKTGGAVRYLRSGKATFVKGDWNDVRPFQEEFAPRGDELWVTNMRVNEHWQTQFDDFRIPYRAQRFPMNILEMDPKDAAACSIESGDWVSVENDHVLTQTGGRSAAQFKAVAYVTDQFPPGVTCSYFNFGQGRLDTAANSVTPGITDPINNRYRFKLGKGRVRGIGESEFKGRMSFVPRNLT
jgi:anaerobic selenocysteine-containing dehydrogenase